MNDLLDYAEVAAQDNMRENIEIAGMIQREANTVMVIMLGGAGAALAFSATKSVDTPALLGAATAAYLYLFSLAALLNWKCLGLIAYPARSNEPKNLYKAEYELDQIREWELENLQVRITEAAEINDLRSIWLNRCRYAMTLTPVIAFIGAALACLLVGVDLAAGGLAAVLGCLGSCS